MKKIIFFILISCSSFTSTAQELKITLDETSDSIKLYNRVRFNISIVNTSDDPILIYKGTDTKYGGIKKGWSLKVNGTEKSLPRNSYPRMLKYRKFHFKNLEPGESIHLAYESKRFRIKDVGKNKITFSFKQTNGGMDLTQGHSGQAKELAKKITNLDLEKTYEFYVPSEIAEKFVDKDIAYEELEEAPMFYSTYKASLNPTNAHKVFLDLSLQEEVDEKEIELLGQLKNMRKLILHVGNQDVDLPKAIVDIPLLELELSSKKGGKINLPQGFLNKPSLKNLVLSRLTNLPDFVKNHPQLERLYLTRMDLTEIPEWVTNLKQLKSLVLSGNPISEIPKEMLNLTTLEEFAFQGTQIKENKNLLKYFEYRFSKIN